MRKFLILDTETAPVVKRSENDVRPEDMRVYDLGYIVADKTGMIYEEQSIVVTDTFYNDKLMNSAYYAEKLPQYHAGIGSLWKPMSFLSAYKQLKGTIREYGIKDIWAYNVNFDRRSLNATIDDYSNGFQPWFFPYGVNFRDIWDLAGHTICNTQKYVLWCIENGFVSEKGNPQTSAEVVFRYLSDDKEFIEEHTALSDCRIELSIFLRAMARHPKRPKSCGQGWRPPSKIAKAIREDEERKSELILP